MPTSWFGRNAAPNLERPRRLAARRRRPITEVAYALGFASFDGGVALLMIVTTVGPMIFSAAAIALGLTEKGRWTIAYLNLRRFIFTM
jgi:hypothetical protein